MQQVHTLLTIYYTPLGSLEGGSLALWKGTLDTGETDYALIDSPDAQHPNYLGSLSPEDALDDRHAILGALTKFRLILEMMSQEGEDGEI